jgi:hypothetical protein
MTDPIITQPEHLRPEQLSTIENLPTERTATALLDLLDELARQTDREQTEYVQIAGAIREHGAIGLYQVLEQPGSASVTGFVVAWKGQDARHGEGFDLRTFPAAAEEEAKEVYELWAEEPTRGA